MQAIRIGAAMVLCGAVLATVAHAEEHEVLTWVAGGLNWVDGSWTDSRGDTVEWVDGSIARHGGANMGSGVSNTTVTAYAFYWDKGDRVLNQGGSVTLTVRLDAGGFVYGDISGPAKLMSKNHGYLTFDLIADQQWTTRVAADRGIVLVDNSILTTSVGATLTLANYLHMEINSICEYPGRVVLQDHAKLTIDEGMSLGADELVIRGANAVLDVSGSASDTAKSIELADGAALDLDAITWDIGTLKVSGGVCKVTGVFKVPQGSGFAVDVAEGATLDFQAAVLDAGTGASVVPVNSGSGTLNLSQVVTDDPVTESPFVIGTGKTVFVLGDGLGKDVTVQLNGGQMAFAANATVAAKVEVRAPSSITVAADAEGTVSGALDSTFNGGTAANLLTFGGKGLKVFSGGATFAAKAEFSLTDGSLLVRDGNWVLGANAKCTMEGTAETLIVSNATVDTWTDGYVTFAVNVDEGHDGAIELRDGGVMRVGKQSHLQLGYALSKHGTLRINGGHYYDRYANAQTYLGSGAGVGLIEILAGTFAPSSLIQSMSGTAKILWKGGTWLFDNDNSGSLIQPRTVNNVNYPVTVVIDGDCTMRFNIVRVSGVVDTISTTITDLSVAANSSWTCTENGTLTLTNSSAIADKVFTFNVRPPFTNMNLRVGTRIKVAVDPGCPAANLNDWIVGAGSASYADIWADGTDPLPMEGVSVLAGGSFDLATAGTMGFRNLVFADGATLASSVPGTTLALEGALTLPSAGESLAYDLAPGSAPCTLITASDGVSGNPTFVRCRGSKTAIFTVGANDLSFDCPGTMLFLR